MDTHAPAITPKRSLELSRLTRTLTSDDHEQLAEMDTAATFARGHHFAARTAKLAKLQLATLCADGMWTATTLGREVIAWRKRGPVRSETVVSQ